MRLSNFSICSLRGKRGMQRQSAVHSRKAPLSLDSLPLFLSFFLFFFKSLILRFNPNPKINSSPRRYSKLYSAHSRVLLAPAPGASLCCDTPKKTLLLDVPDAPALSGCASSARLRLHAVFATDHLIKNRKSKKKKKRDPPPNAPSACFDRDEMWTFDAKFPQLPLRRRLVNVSQVQRITQAARLLTAPRLQIKQTEAQWDENQMMCGETHWEKKRGANRCGSSEFAQYFIYLMAVWRQRCLTKIAYETAIKIFFETIRRHSSLKDL